MLDLYEWCKEQRAHGLECLKDLESGLCTIGEYVDGKLFDQTKGSIESYKHEIAQMDELIADYEKRNATRT